MQYQVIIALGSNLKGKSVSPRENLCEAASLIKAALGSSIQLSSFWQSEPQGMSHASENFVNAVAVTRTSVSAENLLRVLQNIEVSMGRSADHGYYESRIIDLDIIAYGDCKIAQPDLVVPHPRAHERLFVLLPLAELLPDLVLPGQSVSVRELIPMADAMEISCLPQPG
jgi:2-amino-4-hydroxy-6-hydroxymethyldihydropteridine diphosphokinase